VQRTETSPPASERERHEQGSRPPVRSRRPSGGAGGRIKGRPAAVIALTGLFVVFAVYHAVHSVQLRGFLIMTDELQYLKLGLNIPHGVLPELHGKYLDSYNFLYPLMIAPLGAVIGSIPALFVSIHVINPFVMASVVFPTYLLTRELVESRLAALAGAAISVAGPWLAFTSLIMAENVAYPAFMWALLGMQRALAAPSLRRDLVAIAGIGLAIAARTQLVSLLPVFLLAVFLERARYETVLARLRSGRGGANQEKAEEEGFKRGLRAAAIEHRSILLIAAAIAAAVGVLTLVISPDSVVGLYGNVFDRPLLPRDLASHMARHLATLAVGFGVVPVVLAAAFVFSELRSPTSRTRHSFAWLLLLSTAAVLLVSSSSSINFAAGDLNDRHVFYVLPALAVAAVVTLAGRDVSWQSIALAGAAVALLVTRGHYQGYDANFWVGAPSSAIDPVLNGKLLQLNNLLPGTIGIKTFLLVATLALSGVTALVAHRLRGPVAVAIVAVPVFGWLVAETQYQYDSQGPWQKPTVTVVSKSFRTRSIGDVDWIDKALPSGSVALAPSVSVGQTAWWQDEFFNRRVDKLFRVVNPAQPAFYSNTLVHLQLKTLFHDQVRIDPRTGAISGLPTSRMASHVVTADHDARFAFAGARTIAEHPKSGSTDRRRLLRVDVPYKAAFFAEGLLDDGWTVRNRTPILLFPRSSRAERWRVSLTLAAPFNVHRRRSWLVTAPGIHRSGRLTPNAHTTPRFSVCVGATGTTKMRLLVRGRTVLPDGRRVGLLLTTVRASPTGVRCGAGSK
jgi:hypothetical protein